MTSSMLAGEKRWASARRGGLTVLGKVAVPKPLNLPSQRLENHGLDPNVEIVPKGTLSWGSRPSSSNSNAWGSSTLSPNADGGNSSPSHLSACPSSGGSATRPSTAGSDRTNEPAINAWVSSSRPSSASGALSSNQTSSALSRPRSADTRPGSSQLSRFAEPLSEHSVAWGATDTAERLGVLSSKNEGFSISSGDFPTLGSDRDGSGKTAESQDHGSHSRPSSASGKVLQSREKTTASHPDVKGGEADVWKRDGQSAEGGPQPGMEMWHGEAHQNLGPNIPPQHFDAWRAPPVNPPAGVWYGGPPGGQPYGAPVPPGGFPMEPFPYFRPQIPPPALANSQPVPPPGPGPRGHNPRGGDLYRPQMPDAGYARPGMPFRPGFYPGPVAFEGYYRPPMGYCNSNEREIPLISVPPGPPVYNRYSGPNTPYPSNSYARTGGHGSSTKPFPERLESAHPDNSKGPYKVLLKPGARGEGENWEHSSVANGPYPDGSNIGSLQKHEWGVSHNNEAELYARRTTGTKNSHPCSYDDQGGKSSDITTVNSFEGIDHIKAADGNWSEKSRFVEPSSRVPQSSSAQEKGSTLPVATKDSTLMQKVESLNAKVRASDGFYETSYASEEEINKSQVIPKLNNLTNETGNTPISFERSHKSGNTIAAPPITTGNKGGQSTAAMPRRAYHGAQSRSDHIGKARFSSHDDGWRKKPIAAEFSNVSSATSVDASNVHVCESGHAGEAVEHAVSNITGSDGKESLTELHDSADNQEQRAKMKELARQRALLLQKEEEERTREQKAKALAKLEELDRRKQAGNASSQKAEKAPTTDVTKHGLEESSLPELVPAATKLQEQSATLAARSDVVEVSDCVLNNDSEGSNPSIELQVDAPKTVPSERVIPQAQGLLPKPNVHTASTTHGKVASQSSDAGFVKHKRGYKQRPYTVQKNSDQKSVPVSATEISMNHNDVVVSNFLSTEIVTPEVGSSAESIMASNGKFTAESSVQQRRKGNRTSNNKHKVVDAPSGSALPSPVQKDSYPAKVHTQHEKSNALHPASDIGSVQAETGGDIGGQASEQCFPLPTEEGHDRIINQWKPQQPRRVQRNQYSNRSADKFHGSDSAVWAPVRSQSKADASAEASLKNVSHSAGPLKSDDVAQSNSKSKRAEIERYIPKPVAKELAQCGTQQPMSNSSNPPCPDGTNVRGEPRSHNSGGPQPTGSTTESVGFTVDSREGDGMHNNNRQGKAPGMWRQRGSTELALDPGKNTEGESLQSEYKSSSEFYTSDGWNMPGDSADLLTTSSVVKDLGTTGKGKKYPSKGHRSTGNTAHKSSSGESQRNHTSGSSGVNQMDNAYAAKENRSTGNRTPHWQPKAHILPIIGQQEGGSSGSQDVTVDGDRPNRKDYHHHKVHVPPCDKNESTDIGICQPVQAASEKKVVVDVPNVGNHDPRREKRPASFKRHPYSSNQGPLGMYESAPAKSAEVQRDQNFSGFRRNKNQDNRVVQGQEPRGDWSSGHDNRQLNISSSLERRANNMHYEYQPVGEYNHSKSKTNEGSVDGSRNVGPRYRERSQMQSKRRVDKMEPRVKTSYD